MEILRTWYKKYQRMDDLNSKFRKKVILIRINWNLSGTYQYWGTKLKGVKIPLNIEPVLTVKIKSKGDKE